jgi:hypothetical protein
MNLAEKRAELAKAAVNAGLEVKDFDIVSDETYAGIGEFQSQYIEIVVDAGLDVQGYKQRDEFTVRIADHYQVKSCGAKAALCTFSDGEQKIMAAFVKIGADKLAFLGCIESGGDAREFAA